MSARPASASVPGGLRPPRNTARARPMMSQVGTTMAVPASTPWKLGPNVLREALQRVGAPENQVDDSRRDRQFVAACGIEDRFHREPDPEGRRDEGNPAPPLKV